MYSKSFLRKKYRKLRKKKYFKITPSFFNPLSNLIKKKFRSKKFKISFYHPINYEVDVLEFLIKIKKFNAVILLPNLNGNFINFSPWKQDEPLTINKFGVPEPTLINKNHIPDVILVPLLAFDNQNYRLGYGKGFYDKYLNKYKKKKKIITIGIAFSFQKYNKLPIKSFDVKLDYILTEKGIKNENINSW